MTSNDSFVTIEIFNARMDRQEAIIEKYIALMQKENADFRMKLMDNLSNEFKNIHAEIGQLDKKIDVQTARIDSLFHWNYWIIAFIVALFMTPSVIEGIKSFSKALTEGFMNIFRRKIKN